jgi:hypothetical protein
MSTSNSDNCNNYTWGVAGGSAALGFLAGLLIAKMPADGFSKNNLNWFKNNDINNDKNNIMNNNDNNNIMNNIDNNNIMNNIDNNNIMNNIDNNNIMNNNDNNNENNNNDILAGKHKHIKGDAKIET